jgi:hypothetical protein
MRAVLRRSNGPSHPRLAVRDRLLVTRNAILGVHLRGHALAWHAMVVDASQAGPRLDHVD